MLMKYGFNINGETYSEEDAYQTMMGCGDGTENPEVFDYDNNNNNNEDENDDDDDDDDFPKKFDDPNDSIITEKTGSLDGTWIPLPSYNSYFRLTFEDDLNEVPVNRPVNALLEVKNGQDADFDLIGFYPAVFGYYSYEDSTDVFTVDEGEYSGLHETSMAIVCKAKPMAHCTYSLFLRLKRPPMA